jgi:hypothetical protein
MRTPPGVEIIRIASQFAIQLMSVAMQLRFCIAVSCDTKPAVVLFLFILIEVMSSVLNTTIITFPVHWASGCTQALAWGSCPTIVDCLGQANSHWSISAISHCGGHKPEASSFPRFESKAQSSNCCQLFEAQRSTFIIFQHASKYRKLNFLHCQVRGPAL